MPPPKRTPKEIAIETLAVVIARLKGPQWLDDLERKQLAVACEHAREHIARIGHVDSPPLAAVFAVDVDLNAVTFDPRQKSRIRHG